MSEKKIEISIEERWFDGLPGGQEFIRPMEFSSESFKSYNAVKYRKIYGNQRREEALKFNAMRINDGMLVEVPTNEPVIILY